MHQRTDGDGRKRHAGRASANADQQTFQQKLAHDASKTSAKCVAYREFARATSGPHQQQARHIDGRDQQHQKRHRHYGQQRLLEIIALIGETLLRLEPGATGSG